MPLRAGAAPVTWALVLETTVLRPLRTEAPADTVTALGGHVGGTCLRQGGVATAARVRLSDRDLSVQPGAEVAVDCIVTNAGHVVDDGPVVTSRLVLVTLTGQAPVPTPTPVPIGW
jgi:hypothetical protein